MRTKFFIAASAAILSLFGGAVSAATPMSPLTFDPGAGQLHPSGTFYEEGDWDVLVPYPSDPSIPRLPLVIEGGVLMVAANQVIVLGTLYPNWRVTFAEIDGESPIIDRAFGSNLIVVPDASPGFQMVAINRRGVALYSRSAWRLENVQATIGIPEPATWALMLGGFGAAGATLRVRRRRATGSKVHH